MNTRYTLRAVALASVCLAPLAAHAQDDFDSAAPAAAAEAPNYDNEALIGVRGQTQTSGVFGRYSGQVNSGAFVFGGFKLQGRDEWKSGGTRYFSVVGKNLDFGSEDATQQAPDASITAKAGQQGTWGVKASYDAISYAQSTGYSTPFTTKDALPSNLHNLPAALIAQTLADTIARDSSNMYMGTRRDVGQVGGQYTMADTVTYSANIKHEHKTGFMEQSARISGGATYPEQIDYTTDRYDAGMAFNTKRLQATMGMNFTNFSNNDPYSYVQMLNNALASPSNGGVIGVAQAPGSNTIGMNTSLAYNITPVTRLNANFAYGVTKQNEAFQAGTSINTTTTQQGELAGSPGSLHGLVNTYFANLALTSRPLPRLDTKVSYTYDQREDKTPNINQCNPVYSSCTGAGSGIYGDSGAGSIALSNNMPHYRMGWTKQTAKAEAGYRVLESTRVSAGLTYADTQKNDYTAVDHMKETTEWLRVNSRFSQSVDGMAGYSHSVRASSDMSSSDSAYNGGIASVPYLQLGRTQDQFKTRVGYQPIEEVQVGFNGRYTYDKYHIENDDMGMLSDSVLSFGPDISFEPIKSVTAHVFYNYEQNFHNNQGMTAVTSSTTGVNGFPINSQTTDITHVAGASVDWKPKDEWKLGMTYTFVEGDTYQSISDGVLGVAGAQCGLNATGGNISNATCPIAGIQSQVQSLKVTSAYQFAPNLTWFVTYGLDYMKDNDYAYNVQGYDTVGGQLNPNDVSPRYFVNSFSTAVQLKW